MAKKKNNQTTAAEPQNPKVVLPKVELDEHDELNRRQDLGVQTINLILEPKFEPVDQFAMFKNTGGMLTFVTVLNRGEEPVTVSFPSLNGQHDIQITLAPDRILQFGPFSVNHFNHADDCVWMNTSLPILVAVQRLGV